MISLVPTVRESVTVQTLRAWSAHCGEDAIRWLRHAAKDNAAPDITEWAVAAAAKAAHYARVILDRRA